MKALKRNTGSWLKKRGGSFYEAFPYWLKNSKHKPVEDERLKPAEPGDVIIVDDVNYVKIFRSGTSSSLFYPPIIADNWSTTSTSQRPVSKPEAIPNGPHLWDNILQCYSDESIIAGGAVRDYILGGTHKDIDVFTWAGSLEEYRSLFTYLYNPRYAFKKSDEYSADKNIEVLIVTDYEGFGNRVNEIVVVETIKPEDRVKHFDIGLCQVFYKDGMIHMLEAFEHDLENKTITVFNNSERSMERAKKLQEKYKEFTIVVKSD